MQRQAHPGVPVKKIGHSAVSEHSRVQRRVHNDVKREWLCVIDNALDILP